MRSQAHYTQRGNVARTSRTLPATFDVWAALGWLLVFGFIVVFWLLVAAAIWLVAP